MCKYLRLNQNCEPILLAIAIIIKYQINKLAVRVRIKIRVKLTNKLRVIIKQYLILVKILINLLKKFILPQIEWIINIFFLFSKKLHIQKNLLHLRRRRL